MHLQQLYSEITSFEKSMVVVLWKSSTTNLSIVVWETLIFKKKTQLTLCEIMGLDKVLFL